MNPLKIVALPLILLLAAALSSSAQLQASPSGTTAPNAILNNRPWEYGAITQGGTGLTEDRNSFKFIMAGAHLSKVLTGPIGPGLLRGTFEYGVEAFPFWQSYTPTFYRANCVAVPGTTDGSVSCSPAFRVGGTFSGVSVTPIILRWNIRRTRQFAFWGQGAGGVLWTNHKYPAFGGTPYNLQNDGPSADASVWNFTPQAGVGVHWFLRPHRSLDFGANAVHVSSASLGDRNPGVNASVQFTLGYTWWK